MIKPYRSLKDNVIDRYLRDVAEDLDGTISNVIEVCSERLGVSMSTIHRWRSGDTISSCEDILNILVAVNRRRDKAHQCTLKDAAILCNFRSRYRLPKESVSPPTPELAG